MKPNYFLVHIYRSGKTDCSNGGVSSRVDMVVLLEEGADFPEDLKRDKCTVMRIRRRDRYGDVIIVPDPSDLPSPDAWLMSGGNFAYSSDSRFLQYVSPYPVHIHDRVEP